MKFNVSKDKELVVDFFKHERTFPPLHVAGFEIKSFRVFKVIIEANVKRNEHIDYIVI